MGLKPWVTFENALQYSFLGFFGAIILAVPADVRHFQWEVFTGSTEDTKYSKQIASENISNKDPEEGLRIAALVRSESVEPTANHFHETTGKLLSSNIAQPSMAYHRVLLNALFYLTL
ncbi:hypothetical protein M408DRAFT_11697 [Serendipita vermifera MAFF 305830]|uniref:Uncharacterized protein n=1 Tax=Serendipita vermifera MAFF 305830 TaxID=933852 RepID=A0A0C2W9S1_SERVB|nr:hypothetical protein M408DRAFT_11697 [Serendipita vermifera MAFF 305830]